MDHFVGCGQALMTYRPWGVEEVEGWRASVDELPGDLLQSAEGLLKLEALGDGLLLGCHSLLLRGRRGLAALAQRVGRHDDQLLCHWASRLLFLPGRAGWRLGDTAAVGGGWFLDLHWEFLLDLLD